MAVQEQSRISLYLLRSNVGENNMKIEVQKKMLNKLLSKTGCSRVLLYMVMLFSAGLVNANTGIDLYAAVSNGNVVQGAEAQDEQLAPDNENDKRSFFLTYQQGVERALNRRRESDRIKSVISSEQSARFADYSIEGAVLRLPGVQRGETGKINIRGVGYGKYNVTVDGQRFGSTGLGDRSFDIGSISADLVRDIEVIKVLRPDMHADGLAGTVNLVTHQPVGGARRLNASIGGGGTPRYFTYSGLASNVALNYYDSPRDDFSIVFGLSYQTDHQPSEMLGIDYGTADFGNGPVDVIQQVAPGIYTNQSSRLGGRLQMTYKSSERTSYNLQGLVNFHNRDIQRHNNSWSAGSDWFNQDSTGLAGGLGSYGYDATLTDMDITQYAFNVGAKHRLDFLNVDYSIGWAQATIDHQHYSIPFLLERLNHEINFQNRNRPVVKPTNINIGQDGSIDRRLLRLQDMDHIIDFHIDNHYSGNLNLEFPFRMGSFKLGGDALISHKDGAFTATDMRYIRPLTQFRFFMVQGGRFDVLDDYHMPWIVDMEKARNFIDTNEPLMRVDENVFHRRSDVWNYDAYENIYSGYGMLTFEVGNLTLLGGVRIEHSDNTYDGRKVLFNQFGTYLETSDTTSSNSNTHVFPNAQITYDIGGRSNIRLAWSRTIARPDFNLMAPFERIDNQNMALFRGNPDLEPVTSDNLDFMFELYLPNTGMVGVGVFYKELSGFIVADEQTLSGGDFDGWSELSFVNGDEAATIYGIEASWQQNLTFLPGFLENLGVYANYTYIHSEFDTQNRTNVSFPGHSPHVMNTALIYNQGRYSGQISYHWRGKVLQTLQDTTSLAPSINGGQQVYMDRYRDNFDYLTASLGFRISSNFQLWGNVFNMTGARERIHYDNTSDYYPREITRSGFGFRAGILYTL